MQTLIRGSSMNSSLSYCDYIAHTVVRPALNVDSEDAGGTLSGVSKVHMDLAKEGWMKTTKRTIEVTDVNGREYRITIEDITK
jgi:hypothetical protein